MGRKPNKLQAIKIPWKVYKEVKDEALERDTTIKDVVVEKIRKANMVPELEEYRSRFKRERNNCLSKKRSLENKVEELKKQLGSKEDE